MLEYLLPSPQQFGGPLTIPALRRVKGMGPGRLEKYGEEILAITARAAD